MKQALMTHATNPSKSPVPRGCVFAYEGTAKAPGVFQNRNPKASCSGFPPTITTNVMKMSPVMRTILPAFKLNLLVDDVFFFLTDQDIPMAKINSVSAKKRASQIFRRK